MINTKPCGADIYLDEEFKGVTPLVLHNLKKGEVNLEIKKDNYNTINRNLTIDPLLGETKIDVTLENRYGSLSVISLPNGAKVLVDEKEMGVTPICIDNIRKSDVTVKLIKAGFETESKNITLRKAERLDLFIKLRQPATSSDGRFIDHKNGTITDTKTGPMWTREDSFLHTGRYLNWEQANLYVSNLNTGSYHDWRLPTIRELKEIYEIKKINTDKG